MLVAADEGRFRIEIIFLNVNKADLKIYVFVSGFLSLYAHYFLNGVYYVKRFKILSEFTRFYLGKI